MEKALACNNGPVRNTRSLTMGTISNGKELSSVLGPALEQYIHLNAEPSSLQHQNCNFHFNLREGIQYFKR